MRRDLDIEVEAALPVKRCAQVAVDYANLKSLSDGQLLPLLGTAFGYPHGGRQQVGGFVLGGREVKLDVGLHPRLMRPLIKIAALERHHQWIRELIGIAADGKPLPKEAEQELAATFAEHKLALDLGYRSGSFAPRIALPNADLFWFVSIGVASLFDERGPVYRKVARCANFDGSAYSDKSSDKSMDCGNYVLRISTGGWERSRFCSRKCGWRVSARKSYHENK